MSIEENVAPNAAVGARPGQSPKSGGSPLQSVTLGRWLGAVLVMALVLGGLWFLTRPGSIQPALPIPGGTNGPGKSLPALTDTQLERMVAQATEQVSANPVDKSAWALLAHSNEMLGKFAEAKKAYAKLATLAPNDAQVLADYADVAAVSNGRSLLGEPEALVKRALDVDPKNLKALMLSGALAVEKDDRPGAVGYWERARLVAKDERVTQQIDQNIASVKLIPKETPTPAPVAAGASKVRLIAGPAKLSGRVWLAEDLIAKVPPDATVFIFARPVDGSRMPVALLRKKVKDLPLNFTLDESMAMVKEATLAHIEAAVIVARVSMRGDVLPQAGDLQGVTAPVPIGATGIKLEISEVMK